MNIERNETLIRQWAESNAASLGLQQGSEIKVTYIYNPGGFVNQSYRISAGKTIRHLKLAPDAKMHRLQQWASVSEQLSNRYNAPRLIREIQEEIIPDYRYGLVFEYIRGESLTSISHASAAISKVLFKLQQLHRDQELAAALVRTDATFTYADAFADAYISRFEGDMVTIREGKHLLHFVTEETLDWFDAEIHDLRETVYANPAFRKSASDVVHNDLGWNNVMVDERDEIWMIDWDDLAANGDAAMDYSVLLWPLYNTADWPYWKAKVIEQAGEELYERLSMYFRASLLDDVIDILADYVDSETIPELREKTQARAQATHLRAYPEYLRLYLRGNR
ncbi:aminoglycoside phosphotransferase family protein [Paenibacillus sp. CF384]|uniref:aminoglycoside phosphotransferase family protein n=1 Tax=Paenibacillus sp. CF384 TaxID=1884382 RepID=UPI00089B7540|nr:aminoglycoside phosphotransferase family protein [Paenibacillus sp. CF384]SDW19606.1 Phosphotransferase enzyme family protein [Paenibacillus sp. CF384]